MTSIAACGPGSPPADTDGGTGDDTSPTSTASSDAPPTSAPNPTIPGPDATDTNATDTGVLTTDPVTTGVLTTGFETDTDTGFETDGDTGEPSEPAPGVPLDQFVCGPAARWLTFDLESAGGSWAVADSRGHLRVSTLEFDFLDFDEAGVLVEQFAVPQQWHLGGLDGADELYLPFIDTGIPPEQRHRWLRKFSLDGTLLWEVDRGFSFGLTSLAGRAAVAPDGTTLLSQRDLGRVQRFAADGSLLLDKELGDKPFDEALAMNTAGVAAAVRYGEAGAVLALTPDAAVAWEHPFELPDRAVAEIDESGRVTAAPVEAPLEVLRLAADGAVQWHQTLGTLPKFAVSTQTAIAVNELGETAVSGTGFSGDFQAAFVVKFTPAGEIDAIHQCDNTSAGRGVAIDEAGAVYLVGQVWDTEGPHLFAAAFD
ncbi:hypothetical protein [Nannocystis punicea]|uniref:PQQ-like domain-containing protein n=1 Tax=Nannocystis punicea TaxID=2995304 RepID=A0ABY7H8L3_9BACT|nr:hypothetical protein [Nannocystis poenicansa]WAS95334.1 hypothetical protein O0S08_04170 [Nannocystis poenicansa]